MKKTLIILILLVLSTMVFSYNGKANELLTAHYKSEHWSAFIVYTVEGDTVKQKGVIGYNGNNIPSKYTCEYTNPFNIFNELKTTTNKNKKTRWSFGNSFFSVNESDIDKLKNKIEEKTREIQIKVKWEENGVTIEECIEFNNFSYNGKAEFTLQEKND